MIIRLVRWISAAIIAPLWWPLVLILLQFEVSGQCKQPRIPNHPELGLATDWVYCGKVVQPVLTASVIAMSVSVAVGALIVLTLARRGRLQTVRVVIVASIAGAVLCGGTAIAVQAPLATELFYLFVGWAMGALISATFAVIAGLPLDKSRAPRRSSRP